MTDLFNDCFQWAMAKNGLEACRYFDVSDQLLVAKDQYKSTKTITDFASLLQLFFSVFMLFPFFSLRKILTIIYRHELKRTCGPRAKTSPSTPAAHSFPVSGLTICNKVILVFTFVSA